MTPDIIISPIGCERLFAFAERRTYVMLPDDSARPHSLIRSLPETLKQACMKKRRVNARPLTAAAAALVFPGMAGAAKDAEAAALKDDAGPAEPAHYPELLAQLQAAQGKFPPLYEENFVIPFTRTMQQLGAEKFAAILVRDKNRERSAGLMLDLAQAILQRATGYAGTATRAYQELVSDLYAGFLSAEDRKGIKPPDRGVIPPLVKWGYPESGPYTWPVDGAASFQVKAGVVSLPPPNATLGLVAWSTLGHETAGHDILHADTGLQRELARALQKNLLPLGAGLADYWSKRIDETSSDVMGLLNIGPAAGIGLIAYFRGLNAAFTNSPHLSPEGPKDDDHPADLLRGYLAAEVVALLKFKERVAWSNAIARETDKDRGTIVLDGWPVSYAVARRSAKILARTLVQTKAKALEGHALGEIQNWREVDEEKVGIVRNALRAGEPLPSTDGPGRIYAAHIVAGAVIEACATGTGIPLLQSRMIALLSTAHEENPSWSPLYVLHSGEVERDYFLKPALRKRR